MDEYPEERVQQQRVRTAFRNTGNRNNRRSRRSRGDIIESAGDSPTHVRFKNADMRAGLPNGGADLLEVTFRPYGTGSDSSNSFLPEFRAAKMFRDHRTGEFSVPTIIFYKQ